MSEATAETTPKPEKKELPKIKIHQQYRLINGEWDQFAEAAEIDKSEFFLVFRRELTADGELVSEVEYDGDGNELQKTVNTFDDKGRVVKTELFNEGAPAESTEFTYDEKGRTIKEVRNFEEGFPLTTYLKYDDENRVTEKRVDDDEGELQKRETYTYNTAWKDKVEKHVVYDEEDKPSLEEEYEYEERDGEVKMKKLTVRDHSFGSYRRTETFDPKSREDNIGYATFNEKDKVIEYVKVIFDEKGRELEEQSFSINDSDNFHIYYTYDDNDRVIAQEQHQADKIINKINRRFGESGYAELIAIRSFSRGMYVDYYEYEFHS